MTDDSYKMLVVYVDETDRVGNQPMYEAIVGVLQRHQLAGATVQTGLMGYGAHGYVHRRRLFGISDDRPVVITSIDKEQKLRTVLPLIQTIVKEGLIVLVDVEVIPLQTQA